MSKRLPQTDALLSESDDDYRARADECQRMAAQAARPQDKATWLKLAAGWQMLIRRPWQTPAERFDAMERVRGTVQARSLVQH
jgi:hypothetical protein